MCGNENTIVAFQILDPRRTFTYARTPAEPFPNYVFDGCVRLKLFNQSLTYQFNIQDQENFHPRYCLAFCTKYEQKYALINNEECLCTNTPMKDEENNVDILTGQDCSQQCSGNYFYSCGNENNLTIYSMYVLQPKCRHGKIKLILYKIKKFLNFVKVLKLQKMINNVFIVIFLQKQILFHQLKIIAKQLEVH